MSISNVYIIQNVIDVRDLLRWFSRFPVLLRENIIHT